MAATCLLQWLNVVYVTAAFMSALCLGAFKGLLVGPVAGLLLIIGNIAVIILLFPAHVIWTVFTIFKTRRLDLALKVALLFALPLLLGIWLGLSVAGSLLVGVGYGFFTPWVSAFEAFRQGTEFKKFFHCLVDGTWGTIRGSCTVVRDFADICYHSYPLYLKELRESPSSDGLHTLRLVHIPACILVGLMGFIVEIPLYTAIAVMKSPYLLFKGWQRLIHDLISREGPFLETACIPVAGLTILMWPLVVIGSILMSIFSSFFVALYGTVVVYQERSFRRGVAYVIAMVAEFDEYTNDWLYLREGSILPKPRYRKKNVSRSRESSLSGRNGADGKSVGCVDTPAPGMLVPSLAPSRSVRESFQEVTVVQIWGNMIKHCEMRGRELLEGDTITVDDLREWLKAKNGNEGAVVGVGLPSYSLLQTLLHSIKAGSGGLLLFDDLEITHLNRPQDRLLDWFFQPVMLLKEQITALKMDENEVRFLEKLLLFGRDVRPTGALGVGGVNFVPQDSLRAAQIEGISRRMMGITRSVSKFPTYRRKFRQIVKGILADESESREGTMRSTSITSSYEIV